VSESSNPQLTVLDHPLVHHALAHLREEDTPPARFTEWVDRLSVLLGVEATRALPSRPTSVTTPLETMEGRVLKAPAPVLVPILRAGLGMVPGLRRLIPEAAVGHVGMERDHDTLQPREYYAKVPDRLGERVALVLDPMLATGGSATAAISFLKERGAGEIRFLCLVAAPEGVQRLARDHPEVRIFAAALDRELNDVGYILPGLGDAGDRIFGTL